MNGGARINLEDAWPISDEEGRSLTGYTFTIENKCEDPVNYIIALESLESTKGLEYLNNNYVKLAIDDEIERRYGSLDTIENVVLENDPETIRETKEVTTATVEGNSINEHTIRIWLSEDAPLTEQNKVFTSRVRITGGQGVENTNVPATADSCFEIDENGEILGYDESCGESVVIPAKVNGTPVKTIDSDAFKTTITYEKITYTKNGYTIEENADYSMVVDEGLMQGTGTDAYYFVVYKDSENVQNRISYWKQAASSLGITHDIPVYYDGIDEIPKLEKGQEQIFSKTHSEGEDDFATKKIDEYIAVSIKSLNLSKTRYLEKIEASAFSNVPVDITELSEYENYKTSLTSLTFGENTNSLSIGTNAFANIDVENLDVYTSYVPVDDTSFAKANINNLTIKATEDNKKISSKILSKVVAKNLVLDEGIEELTEANGVDTGELVNAQIDTLTLPTTLNNEQVRGRYLSQYVSQDKTTYSTINNLIIKTPIDSIGDNDFMQSTIKNVVLPDTVKTIGKSAFAGSKIESINLPKGVTSIADSAFYQSTLKSITIPSSVTIIGDHAFAYSSITDITFENSIESPGQLNILGSGAFKSSALKSITIPSTLHEIEMETFYNCNYLESLTFEDTELRPSQLGSINDYAFAETAIIDLIIPSSVSLIGEKAFYKQYPNSNYLKTIVFENTIEKPSKIYRIFQEAFYGNQATNIILPPSITSIYPRAFANNPSGTIIVQRSQDGLYEGRDCYGNATVTYE